MAQDNRALSADPLHQTTARLSEISQSSLDRMPTSIAVCDDGGTIILVSASWRRFAAANDAPDARAFPGATYLAGCDAAAEAQDADAAEAQLIGRGLRESLAGARDELPTEYLCYSPSVCRWFSLRAVSFVLRGRIYALVSHDDRTERKQTEIARDASQLQLVFDIGADAITRVVDDDGNGFQPPESAEPDHPRSLGLIMMHERAIAVNGTLQIASANGSGTRVIVVTCRNSRR